MIVLASSLILELREECSGMLARDTFLIEMASSFYAKNL
jgi:hypothetical protein